MLCSTVIERKGYAKEQKRLLTAKLSNIDVKFLLMCVRRLFQNVLPSYIRTHTLLLSLGKLGTPVIIAGLFSAVLNVQRELSQNNSQWC